MAEIIQRDSTWTFDGDALRLVPGHDKNVSLLRRTLGELAVPAGARRRGLVRRGQEVRTARASGCATARTRCSTRPAAGSRSSSDPYQLTVDSDRLRRRRVLPWTRSATDCSSTGSPPPPSTAICCQPPVVPLFVSAGDGAASFDGENVRLEWNWKTEEAKSAAGARTLALTDIQSGHRIPRSAGRTAICVHHPQRAHEGPAEVRPQLGGPVGIQEGPVDGPHRGGVQARPPHPSAPSATPRQLTAPSPPHRSRPRRPTMTPSCAACANSATSTSPASSRTRSSPWPSRRYSSGCRGPAPQERAPAPAGLEPVNEPDAPR